MTDDTFLRFQHLKERGIVVNRPTLAHFIKREGFPPGRLLGPKTRVWTTTEIAAWLETRPIVRSTPDKGRALAEIA